MNPASAEVSAVANATLMPRDVLTSALNSLAEGSRNLRITAAI
jgi:hypothetical protein